MQRFLQATVLGILQGGLYGLVGVGFSLVWGVTNIVNVAQGAFVLVGAYVTWEVHASSGLDPVAGGLLAAVVLFAAGYVLCRALVNLVVNAPIWMTLLLTFGLELAIVNGLIYWLSGDVRSIRTTWASGVYDLGGVRIPHGRLVGLGMAVAATAALAVFLSRTRTGRAIRATGMDRATARLMGIPVRHTYALAFAISAGLAGLAGAMVGTIGTFSPADAGGFTLRSFVVAVLGGLGNMWGALAGGLLLGMVEAWGAQYLSSSLVNAITYGVLVGVLVVRPSGLLGKPFYEARLEHT